ncbi:hypothetical protein I316_03991 [Kwoniella heveanensis BCC8398]|uniref:Uncharacterized protein n=1 Tax=Kwoniella heveanensis BCC8398 TaxID=1296120 RepID=A0A1B9GU08_9TREE|nr:hypothetical protein I316_03991 [Kwoniella heveanensis BCC8398]
MRVSRNNAKTYLNLSIAFNILLLIALFLPTEHAHDLLGDKAWSKFEEYGLTNARWGAGSGVGGSTSLALAGHRGGCRMCDVNQELCEEVGDSNLQKALGYTGTNNRLRRVLAKMRRGEPFTVGVVGGSVSRGHGIDDPKGDDPHHPKNMHRIIFEHLNSLFPSPHGSVIRESGKKEGKNGFVNGARGGVGTDYFSLCFDEHIPDDVDLVLIELAINDELLLRNMNSYEILVRALSDLPNKPAIINLQVFALMFPFIASGGDMHDGVAQYYDVPTISFRNPFLPQVLQNYTRVRDIFHDRDRKKEWTDAADGIDLRHISVPSHNLLARIVGTYIETQLCEMDRIEAGLSEAEKADIDSLYPVEPLPRSLIMQKFYPDTNVGKLVPQCYSVHADKHPLKPATAEGWREWNWKEKYYLIADEPGSKISFRFSTTLGQVELHYLRSYQYHLGTVSCWIDDDVHKAKRLEGTWDAPYNIGRAATIRDDLEPGEHTLHCELLKDTADPKGGHEFRIISVMR